MILDSVSVFLLNFVYCSFPARHIPKLCYAPGPFIQMHKVPFSVCMRLTGGPSRPGHEACAKLQVKPQVTKPTLFFLTSAKTWCLNLTKLQQSHKFDHEFGGLSQASLHEGCTRMLKRTSSVSLRLGGAWQKCRYLTSCGWECVDCTGASLWGSLRGAEHKTSKANSAGFTQSERCFCGGNRDGEREIEIKSKMNGWTDKWTDQSVDGCYLKPFVLCKEMYWN